MSCFVWILVALALSGLGFGLVFVLWAVWIRNQFLRLMATSTVVREEKDLPHFPTLDSLYDYHGRVLRPGASFKRVGETL
jgi:hypothetical protein